MHRRWPQLSWGIAWALAVAAHLAHGEIQTRPLVIAIEDYPPFEYVENSAPTGINVEVITRIGRRLGIPVAFQSYPFPRSWMLLKRGSVDAALSVSYHPSREDHLYFTDDQRTAYGTATPPSNFFWTTEYVFFINRNYADSLRFDSYAQIRANGYRVGTLREYTYDSAFQNAGLTTQSFSLPEDGFRALASGAIDIFPMDRTIGQWTICRLGLDRQLTCLPKPLFSKPYLLVFSRSSTYPDLERVMHDVYAELSRMRASGEHAAIVERYLPPSTAAKLRPLVFVCEEWPPYEYLHDGKPTGIDIELLERIMGRLGRPYEVQFYPWSRAWMLVEKGKADAVLSVSYKASRTNLLYYTPEQALYAETGAQPPDYLYNAEYVFFVKAKRAGQNRFESYAQVKADNLRVGVNRDYSYDPAFQAAGLRTVEFPDATAGFTALLAEDIDLYPLDRTIGLAELERMGVRASVTYHAKRLFAKPYLAPFVRHSDYPQLEELMTAFNRELRQLRESGAYAHIYQQFVPPEPPTPAGPETP